MYKFCYRYLKKIWGKLNLMFFVRLFFVENVILSILYYILVFGIFGVFVCNNWIFDYVCFD